MNETTEALRPAAPEPEPEPDDALDDVQVLIVEDDAGCREALSMALAAHGALVTAVESVGAALRCIAHQAPAVVLSDIEMPEQDGFDLIRQVRALDERHSRRTPAIAVTGLTKGGISDRVRAAGFDAHLAKPLDLGSLIARIRGLIG